MWFTLRCCAPHTCPKQHLMTLEADLKNCWSADCLLHTASKGLKLLRTEVHLPCRDWTHDWQQLRLTASGGVKTSLTKKNCRRSCRRMKLKTTTRRMVPEPRGLLVRRSLRMATTPNRMEAPWGTMPHTPRILLLGLDLVQRALHLEQR